MDNSKQSRAWCFTVNNYEDNEIENAKKIPYDYLIIGKEIGEGGTPHLQGYLYREKKVTFGKIKKMLPRAHLEIAKGTPLDNFKYCSKDGNFEEFGERPHQGKRSDLDEIKESLKTTGRITDVVEKCTNIQQLKFAETAIKYIEKKRNWKPEVYWFHGPSGTGKSKTAYEMMPDLYRKTNMSGQWWDGYDAHEDVLLDDLKPDTWVNYSALLELLDRYECRVQFKGGSRQFLAKRIVITSLFDPQSLFPTAPVDCFELLRRIDEIRIFK